MEWFVDAPPGNFPLFFRPSDLCEFQDQSITVRAIGGLELAYGQTVFLTPEKEHLHRFDKDGLRIK